MISTHMLWFNNPYNPCIINMHFCYQWKHKEISSYYSYTNSQISNLYLGTRFKQNQLEVKILCELNNILSLRIMNTLWSNSLVIWKPHSGQLRTFLQPNLNQDYSTGKGIYTRTRIFFLFTRECVQYQNNNTPKKIPCYEQKSGWENQGSFYWLSHTNTQWISLHHEWGHTAKY